MEELKKITSLMEELKKITRVSNKLVKGAPHETLLVLDAVTGQNGLAQARLFKEMINVTGIIVTKLDGTAKGGITLTYRLSLWELVNHWKILKSLTRRNLWKLYWRTDFADILEKGIQVSGVLQ